MLRYYQLKLSTFSNACDVTWTENCKQTSTDSSVSPVTFVSYIYKQLIYLNLFFQTHILRKLVKSYSV